MNAQLFCRKLYFFAMTREIYILDRRIRNQMQISYTFLCLFRITNTFSSWTEKNTPHTDRILYLNWYLYRYNSIWIKVQLNLENNCSLNHKPIQDSNWSKLSTFQENLPIRNAIKVGRQDSYLIYYLIWYTFLLLIHTDLLLHFFQHFTLLYFANILFVIYVAVVNNLWYIDCL